MEKVTRGIPPVQISIMRLCGKSNASDTTCTDINYEVVWKINARDTTCTDINYEFVWKK